MSLRWRLAVGLAILLAAGLAVFGVTTYSIYAPTQYAQLDSQLTTSIGPVAATLERRAHLANPDEGHGTGTGTSGTGTSGTGTSGTGTSGTGTSGKGNGSPDADSNGPDGGSPGGPPPPVVLATGSYAELVSPTSTIVRRLQVSERVGVPQLTAVLKDASSGDRPGVQQFFTVASVTTGPMWRVLVSAANVPDYRIVLAIPTTAVSAALHHLLLVEAEVAAGLLLVLLAGSWLILVRGLRPLEQMAEDSQAITGGNLSRRVGPKSGPTEVVELGAALDTMLDDLEVAFAEREETEARLRQFLADASHELRTPLTSIQGFAELFRLSTAPGGASGSGSDRPGEDLTGGGRTEAGTDRTEAPGDGAATTGDGATTTIDVATVDPRTVARRIEDEAKRMKRLVDDLLLLARLDQVSEVQSQQVDLAVLAADACAAAVASQPGRPITLDAPQEVRVTGDPEHLRQALGNLLGNALKHTPPGTSVEVTVSSESPAASSGSDAVVTIRDHGPGLGDDGLVHAFDRFWRGDRARAGEGAGLGLSIVAAIAREHRGSVVASDAPGGGAQFALRLPHLDDAASLPGNL